MNIVILIIAGLIFSSPSFARKIGNDSNAILISYMTDSEVWGYELSQSQGRQNDITNLIPVTDNAVVPPF